VPAYDAPVFADINFSSFPSALAIILQIYGHKICPVSRDLLLLLCGIGILAEAQCFITRHYSTKIMSEYCLEIPH
jgi:hypothetical protein